MMRQDPKQLNRVAPIGPTDRQTARLDAARALTRRSQALLAAAGLEAPERRWYVLTIDAGKDISVDKALEEARVERWMPSVTKEQPRRGGRPGPKPAPVMVPTFPGYLFVRIVPTARAWAGLATVDGVRGVLGGAFQPAPIGETELLKFKAFLDDPEAVKALACGLDVGDTVEVDDGPFRHFAGEVVSVDEERARALIEVMLFGRAVPVDLDLAQLTKIE